MAKYWGEVELFLSLDVQGLSPTSATTQEPSLEESERQFCRSRGPSGLCLCPAGGEQGRSFCEQRKCRHTSRRVILTRTIDDDRIRYNVEPLLRSANGPLLCGRDQQWHGIKLQVVACFDKNAVKMPRSSEDIRSRSLVLIIER